MNKYLGNKVIYYDKIDSTQKEVWRKLQNNEIDNGTLIIADIQTDGIGTHGRTWYTSNNNIAFSFLVELNLPIKKIEGFTNEVANVIVNVFKTLYNINLQIKAPNDIIIDNKKVGGILVETKLQGNIVKYMVVGIGINTNQEEFPNEIKDIAVSIKNKFNIIVDNKKIITEICNILEEKLNNRIKGEI